MFPLIFNLRLLLPSDIKVIQWVITITHKNCAVFFNFKRTWFQVQDFPRLKRKKLLDFGNARFENCNFAFTYNTGGRVGLVVRALAFHQCGPGSISALGVIRGLSLLVLYSAMRGFPPGTPVFPSHQKPTFDLI